MIKTKKKIGLMKKSVIGIIVAAVLITVLAIGLAIALDVANTKPYTDPADNTDYYIIKKDDVWSLYQKNKKDMLPIDSYYGYFITNAESMVDLDRTTGEVLETIIVDDTVETEVLGQNFRTLMFPRIEKANLRSVEVHNSHDTYTFLRYNQATGLPDDTGDFILKDNPQISFNQDLFATLYVTAGYTLTMAKIEDPIKDENGEFSEYGLVPEKRMVEVLDKDGEFLIDEETGEYVLEEIDYVPAYYIITDKSGNKHKVIIGDRLVTGAGYYVQYVDMSSGEEVKRDAVYVMNHEVGSSMLVPIEAYINPTLSYPMNSTDFFDVKNFTVMKKDALEDGTNEYNEVVSFSYIDMALREGTTQQTIPYEFHGEVLNEGYFPFLSNITSCLTNIYNPDFVGVSMFSPTDKDLAEYGFYKEKIGADGKPEYVADFDYAVTFDYGIRDENDKIVQNINQLIMIVKNEETGNYYAYTLVSDINTSGTKTLLYTYDMVVEVKGYCFEFLNWDLFDWVSDTIVSMHIAFVDKITVSSPDYSATFEVDNSAKNPDEPTDATKLTVNAIDSKGNKMQTFSHLKVVDTQGNTWDITSTTVTVTSPSGETLHPSGNYTMNVLGKQVYEIKGYISCQDGSKVEVKANEVRVTDVYGKTTTYVRYDSYLFADFYQTLVWATLENSYPMTEEEENALIADKSKWQLTVTLKKTDGVENEYSFYYLTSRKSYVVVNGDGGFYMLTDRVNKIISDANKFFAMEPIIPTDKK